MFLRVVALLLAATLCVAAGVAFAEDSLQVLLDRAESVRSTDSREFSSLLGQINSRVAEATPAQRQQLRYLKVYELGYTGRFDLAISEATALFDEVDDPSLKLRAGALIVNSYAATRNFPEGLRYLDETLELIDRVPDPELRSHGWFAASTIYTQIGQFDLARHYADQILGASQVPRSRCFAAQQKLEAQYQMFLSASEGIVIEPPAAKEISKVIDDCSALGEVLVASFSRGLLARVMALDGNEAAAIDLLEQALPQAQSTHYPRLIGEMHSLLGQLYLSSGDLDRAESHAREAITRSSDIAFSLPLVQAHETLYRVAMKRGDTETAFEQYRLYAEADKAYLDAVKARELAFQMVRQETLQKTQQIDLLNNQNRVLQLEQEVAKQDKRNTQLLIVLMGVLIAFIGYFAWKTKKMQVSFRRLAETDTLTSISNRHHFSRRAEELLAQCARNNEPAALVMFDLDEFKSINDRYGHATGDWVLVQVAAACKRACRRGDLFGRLGGEEFAFLLIGAGAKDGAHLAETCRQKLESIDTDSTGHSFRITASFGVADTATSGFAFHPLLARADEAMYRAKRDGRDRVAMAGDAAAAVS